MGTSSAPEIAILGAGPAGLTAALAAHRLGMRVTVFEQAPSLEPIGGGILLHRNGLRALHALGLQEAFLPQGQIIHAMRLESEAGGILSETDYRTLASPPHDFGMVVLRYTLQDFLVEVAQRESIPLRLGHTITDIAIGEPRDVRLRFAENTDSPRFDAAIACDGVHSLARKRLGIGGREWTPKEAWLRGVTPLAMTQPVVREIWTRDGRTFGLMPLLGGRTHFFCSAPPIAESENVHRDTWIESWRGLGDEVIAMLRAVPDLATMNYSTPGCVTLARWHHGPVFFAGDAAHAMPPNLGQGANAAMVDALIAARILARAFETDGDLEAAGRRYQNARRPFVQRTQTIALQMNRLAQFRAPLLRWGRDTALKTTGHIPPVFRMAAGFTIGDNPGEERYLTPLSAAQPH